MTVGAVFPEHQLRQVQASTIAPKPGGATASTEGEQRKTVGAVFPEHQLRQVQASTIAAKPGGAKASTEREHRKEDLAGAGHRIES